MSKEKERLEIEVVDAEELTLDPENARRHSAQNLSAIRESLERFGQREPLIVDEAGVVLSGNGRLQVMREMGWREVQVIRTTLAGWEKVAYALAANRTAELGRWDFEALGDVFRAITEEGGDVLGLGWEDYDIENILRADWSPVEVNPEMAFAAPERASGGPGGVPTVVLTVTVEQYAVMERAMQKVRRIAGDEALLPGQCLEYIVADWMAGAAGHGEDYGK